MRFLSLIALLLAGCSSNNHDALLNDYARNATNSAMLSDFLTGEALTSGRNSIELMADLGLRQVGEAAFENVEQVSPSLLTACLDVSNVQFLDSAAQVVKLENRALRQAATLWLEKKDGRTKISRLEVGGPC
jgi:hypothetical protein